MLERQQQEGKDFGSQMQEGYLSNINEDQLYQLYTLHQEITTNPTDSSDPTGKS